MFDRFPAEAQLEIQRALTVIEQIIYLLFAKRLDELHTVRERKANRLGKPIEDPIFIAKQQSLRWSQFKDREAGEMCDVEKRCTYWCLRAADEH